MDMERANRRLAARVRQLGCFAVGVLALAMVSDGYHAGAQEGTPGQRTPGVDLNGDPLPAGALARLGTLRWRHPASVTFVAFPDDQTLLTGSVDRTLRLWDRATGKEIRRFAIPNQPVAMRAPQPAAVVRLQARNAGGQLTAALSHDGNTLAVALANNTIQLWDVHTGKEIRKVSGPPTGMVTLGFAPDDKTLAVRGGDRGIHLYDPATGGEVRHVKATQAKGPMRLMVVNGVLVGDVGPLAIAPGGKLLASAETDFDMQNVRLYVKLTDLESGNEVGRIDAMPAGATALAFDPAGKVLAYAGANSIQLCEAKDGKAIREMDLPRGAATLLFTPDGKTLLAKARDGTIEVIDTDSGKVSRVLGDAQQQGPAVNAIVRFGNTETQNLALSRDGKTIATGSGNSVRLWDVTTGNEIVLNQGHRAPVTAIRIARDGKTLLSRGADGFIRNWDLTANRERTRFPMPPNAAGVAFSPDGRIAAVSLLDASVRLLDTDTGKPIRQVRGHSNGTAGLAFTPDGKMLASLGSNDNTIRFTEVGTGNALRQVALPTSNDNPVGNFVVLRGGGPATAGTNLAFSADGKTLVAQVGPGNMLNIGGVVQGGGASAITIRLFEAATGREIGKFPLPFQRGVGSISVSPDCRVIATENADGTLSLWEVASGKERALLGKTVAPAQPDPAMRAGVVFAARPGPLALTPGGATLAYSPDGTLLACRGLDRTVSVLDVATGKEVAQFKGHDGPVTALAFAPDGKTLASGSGDTTMLIWDLTNLKRETPSAPAALPASDIASLWSDLIGPDAGKAFQSIRRLAAAPQQALALLRDEIKPVVPADSNRLESMIADLDSEQFDRRTAANDGLEKLGDLAVPALQQALAGPINLEARRRIEALLAKQRTGTMTSEQVRVVRAVELLERIGTAEARQLLEALAHGAPGALATRQAQSVLDRTK
jgi:WD40 repeat protein